MFLAMPSKPRFGELGSGLNSRPPFMNIKQLLDEVDHDIMNYQNRGLCLQITQTRGFDNS